MNNLFNKFYKYSIDTSSLIDAYNRYYPPDIIPDLWEKFEEMIKNFELIAIKQVMDELYGQDDDLLKWAKTHKEMFISFDEEIQKVVRLILEELPNSINLGKEKTNADLWVIALAKIHNITVITGEKGTGKLKDRKIPDICKKIHVRCFDLLGLFREKEWIFHIK